MVFQWSLIDHKSPQATRSLLSILTNSSGVVVCMVLILSLISTSSSIFFRFLKIFPKAPTTIGITLTFMFHSFIIIFIIK